MNSFNILAGNFSIIVDASDGFASIKGRYTLFVVFSSIFPPSWIFFVLNPEYLDLYGIMIIIFMIEENSPLTTID